MKPAQARRRMVGMTFGSLWLIGVSAFFGIVSLVMVGAAARAWLIVMLAIAAVLIIVGIGLIRAVLKLPHLGEPRTEQERTTNRRFVLIVGLEIGAIMVANGVVFVMGRVALIAPVDLMIVGIHFLPLARLFNVPRYNVTGILFTVIPVLTLMLVSSQARVGGGAAWFVLPSLGCVTVAWLTAAANLSEVRQSVLSYKSQVT
jgi:hypothetical protein